MSIELLIALLLAFGFACDRLMGVLKQLRKNKSAGIELPSRKALSKLLND